MFVGCWEEHNIIDFAVLYAKQYELEELRSGQECVFVSIYNPFNKEIQKLNYFNSLNSNIFQNLYPQKLLNMEGYDLNFMLSPQPTLFTIETTASGEMIYGGPEGLVLSAVAKHINAHLVLKGMAKSFLEKEALSSKTVYGNAAVFYKYLRRFLMYPHEQSQWCFIVPKALKYPSYMNLILPFTRGTWLLYSCSIFVMAIFWFIIETFDSKEKKVSNTMVETLRLVILGGTPYSPKCLVQRFVLVIFLFFNIIFANSYQGSLTSYLTIPRYYPDMNNMNEVIDSELKFAMYMAPGDFSAISHDPMDIDETMEKLLRKNVLLDSFEQGREWLAFHRNVTVMSDRYTATYEVSQEKWIRDGRPLMHVVDESYSSRPSAFRAAVWTSPFLSRFSVLVARLSEAGLVGKWRRDFLSKNQLSSAHRVNQALVVPLAYKHLHAPFVLITVGLSLGFCVFISELVAHNVYRYQNSRIYFLRG
ncbi:uncharacterized protein LOC134541997 [Bacillus rossius redtenbacheri]|uniref:uncharacterized protein LOC134541997 n=1 Tax=Bacillus rossius redtenbacheri TaxID=93214 RepID=UPI002FDE0188